MKRFLVFAIALALLAATSSVIDNAARAQDAANVIKYRQAVMGSMGAHMRAIVAVAKGEVGFVAHVPGHAAGIQAIAGMIADMFPAATGSGETRAKPEIWSDRKGFEAAIANLQAAAANLVKVAGSGDRAAIGGALQATGKTCGGCHKPYRKPKN